MKRDVLFLCQFFYPEYNSSATLPFDTAQYLARQGLGVDAMCGYPKEYTRQENIPLREEKDGVQIRRLHYLQCSRRGKLSRLINYFSFTASVLFRLPILKKYKCVVVYSNPPILPIVPILANRLFKTKFIFVAYDVYPEVAYASHALKRGGTIDKVMRAINRQLYCRAAQVVALTEEMRQFILENRPEIEADRVCVIPNWAHEHAVVASDEDYEYFGFQRGQFIVSYFGNMGVCQDVETMLTAIRMLKDDAQIQFLIAGHGSKMPRVREVARDCPNVTILGFLEGEEFEKALAISACGIVSLEKGLKGTCAPSKYYSYLQSGCPVLAIAEETSYLAKEVEREQIGCTLRIGDGAGLTKAIKKLSEDADDCKVMCKNTRTLYERKYALPIAMRKYNAAVSQVLLQQSRRENEGHNGDYSYKE